jgi:hypothetical protein
MVARMLDYLLSAGTCEPRSLWLVGVGLDLTLIMHHEHHLDLTLIMHHEHHLDHQASTMPHSTILFIGALHLDRT